MSFAQHKRIYTFETDYSGDEFHYLLSKLFPNVQSPGNIDDDRKVRLEEMEERMDNEFETTDQEQAEIRQITGHSSERQLKLDNFEDNPKQRSRLFDFIDDSLDNVNISNYSIKLSLSPAGLDPRISFQMGFIERPGNFNYMFFHCDRFKKDWLDSLMKDILIKGLIEVEFLEPIGKSRFIEFNEAYNIVNNLIEKEEFYVSSGEAMATFEKNEEKKTIQQYSSFSEISEQVDYVENFADGRNVYFTSLGFRLIDIDDSGEEEVEIKTNYTIYYKENEDSFRIYSDNYNVGGQKFAASLLLKMLEVL